MMTPESPGVEDQQDEPIPGASSSSSGPSQSLGALIDLRIQKLYNRRLFLMQMQQVTRRTEGREGNTQQPADDDDEDECELERVEKELEELLRQKADLHNRVPTGRAETPEGGVYTLPPPLIPGAEAPLPPEKPPLQEELRKHIQPADSLRKAGAFTQCPSCETLVFTQTTRVNGDSVWLMCALCCMLGGCTGLCLIPFCLDKLKSVRHKCPECQAVIHTYQPF